MKPARIILDGKAQEALAAMYADLKSEAKHIKLSHSNLVSWILVRYLQNSFARDRRSIEEDHFNSKAYMRELMKGKKTPEEIQAAMKEAVQLLNTAKRRRSSPKS